MKREEDEKLILLEIHRMAIHNGPGIRTTVHFKGCQLKCIWCSTPESQKTAVQLASRPENCIGCRACFSACKYCAIDFDKTGRATVKRKACIECMECTDVCYSEALTPLGKYVSAEELYREIVKDKVFYAKSKGGVTFSGGEPLMHVNQEYLKLLTMLKEENISIGFDTCGYVLSENLKKVMEYTDFFLWDLKQMDADSHQKITGVDNALILKNLQYAAKHKKIYIRYPLITGYTDDIGNQQQMADFLLKLNPIPELHIMPMHHMGTSRYQYLGRNDAIENIPLQENDDLERVKNFFNERGIAAKIVG